MSALPLFPNHGIVLLDNCIFQHPKTRKWHLENIHGLERDKKYVERFRYILEESNNWRVTSLVRREYRKGNKLLLNLYSGEEEKLRRAALYDLLQQRMVSELLINSDSRNISKMIDEEVKGLKRELKPKVQTLFTRHGGTLRTRMGTDIDIITTALAYTALHCNNGDGFYVCSSDKALKGTLEDCFYKIKGYDFSPLGMVDCQGDYRFETGAISLA